MKFLSWEKVKSGVELPKRALEMEHMGAMYVSIIILLCKGSELNEKEDLHLLNVVKKST